MPDNKPFKILSIDGGGIKGLYSASILKRLEEKSGKRSGDCFDMICGTPKKDNFYNDFEQMLEDAIDAIGSSSYSSARHTWNQIFGYRFK